MARVLGALGASHLASNMNQLARAVNTGSLPVTPETEATLLEGCQALIEIRKDLLRALGHQLDGPA